MDSQTWIKCTVNAPANQIDETVATLALADIHGVQIEEEGAFLQFLQQNADKWDYVDDELLNTIRGQSSVIFYLENTPADQAKLDHLRQIFGKNLSTSTTQTEDWANNWRDHFHPVSVGERLLIIPAWTDVPKDNRVHLRLEPGLLFGTGTHETTKLCLNALQNTVKLGMAVLDIGCGSGILSIAAALFGAKNVVACDIDPAASAIVSENAKINGLCEKTITVHHGNILQDEVLRRNIHGQYDVIFANIVADVIIPLAPYAKTRLAPHGHFICSGIIAGREDEVENALKRAGFSILERRRDGDWFVFVSVEK